MTEEVLRKIILHYHLFKNAGSSIDALLQHNFPDQWVTKEFVPNLANANRVADWILENPQAVCFSSHTAMLPPPDLPGVQVLPIIFVRHPIDRIASAYAFERKQGSDNFGAVLARNTTLKGYIEVRLALRFDHQCRNFQATRFAQMFKDTEGDENARALRALAEMPFVGLVERFEQSIDAMKQYLAPHFSTFQALPVAKNVSRNTLVPIEEKLADIEAEVGYDCYAELLEANKADMALYQASAAKL